MFHWNLHLEVLISLSELLQRQKREGERERAFEVGREHS